MKRYCVDTSGFSNPLETMPEDIYTTLWQGIYDLIDQGVFAVTQEIYAELILIDGEISEAIKANKENMVLEVSDPSWDWQTYIKNSNQLNADHHDFISEYTGGSPKTICLNDMTIIAMAKSLKIPLISMETYATGSATKRRIPDVCKIEGIQHLSFNDFLRMEKISL